MRDGGVDSGRTVPEVVWVPAHPVHPSGRLAEGGVRFELRELEGKPIAVAFSNLERLVEQLGSWQPWVALSTARLQELLGAAGVTRIVVDPDMASSPGRWAREDVKSFAALAAGSEEWS